MKYYVIYGLILEQKIGNYNNFFQQFFNLQYIVKMVKTNHNITFCDVFTKRINSHLGWIDRICAGLAEFKIRIRLIFSCIS